MKIAITILLSAASLAVSAGETVKQSFERYRTIIDRKPFGPEPVNFDPEAAPGSAAAAAQEGGELTEEQRTAEEQQLASNVRVSMINVSPSGVVKVGFTDSGVSPPENYYLSVGASQNGWSVKSADPGTEAVTLEKGGIDVTVKLGESSGGKGGKGGKASSSRSRGSRASFKSNRPTTLDAQGGKMFGGGGLARLRRKRQEERAKEREEAEKKARAAEEERIAREEREAAEAEEKRRNEEERAQQREALLQIQEQLRKQRQEREAAAQEGGMDAQNEGE